MFDKKQRFTLVELLVTAAILMILLSLLSSSLKSVTSRARQLTCFSNLKTMGTAIGIYLSENEEVFMDHRRGNYFNWHDHLLNLSVAEDSFICPERGKEWESRLSPGDSLPVVTKTVPRTFLTAQHLMPYGYNGFWLGFAPYGSPTNGPLGRNYTLLSDVRFPSKQIVISDSRISANDRWASSIWYPNKFSNEGVSAVHQFNTSILFVDGHVSSEDAQEVNQNPAWDAYWKPHHQ